MIDSIGGITAPSGFQAIGAHVGLRKRKKDLALVWSTVPAHVAASFTTNIVKGASIVWSQYIVEQGQPIRGIIINSGNANSCTGEEGLVHTRMMAETYAACRNVSAEEILVASTGVIGVPLPIDRVKAGIQTIHDALDCSDVAGTAAAEAIMTTDSSIKEFAKTTLIGGKLVTIGGMAKGSGMVHPNMATMLAFITTDINITPELLKKALKESVSQTYNMISVDGDTSTNDMVAVLANGLAGNVLIDEENEDYQKFSKLLHQVNAHFAKAIVKDGEGATKFIEVTVQGTKSLEDAQRLSRTVVSSNLVKTAFFGQEANWGRIIAALGYSGVQFDPQNVSIQFLNKAGSVSLLKSGEPVLIDEMGTAEILKESNIEILIDLHDGQSTATAWGCDLSYDYVRINGSGRT